MVLPQPRRGRFTMPASALPMRACPWRFPVETPHAQSAPKFLTQTRAILNASRAVRSRLLPLSPRCMAESSGDSLERGHPLESEFNRSFAGETGSGSHHRHRSRLAAHRLGGHRQRRGEARLRCLRLRRLRRGRKPGCEALSDFRRALAGARRACARGGGRRADLRQSRRFRHAEARPGASDCAARAGALRAHHRRIRARMR